MNVKCDMWLENRLKELHVADVYKPEKTNEEIAREYGLKTNDVVKLNYNENLYIPRKKIVDLIKEVAEEVDVRIYPQNEESMLKEAIANYLQISGDNVAIGNSSDEVMERIIRLFLGRDCSAVTFAPTFSVFKCEVTYHGASYVDVPLTDEFAVDIDAMRRAFKPNARLLYICSPNNPTANQLKPREIEALIEDFQGIVLVDEAYAEYADYSVVPLTKKYKNLIVLRTFSKAFSLAGLRLGYAIASSSLANVLNRMPAPYVVNVVSLRMGKKMLENIETMQQSVSALKSERRRLINRINEIKGIEAFDSKANFVLFKTAKPCAEVYESALRQGLVIKKLGKLLKHENCLRTTVGLPEMNEKLLKVLSEYMED